MESKTNVPSLSSSFADLSILKNSDSFLKGGGSSSNSSPRSNGSDSARWRTATMHGIGSDGLLSKPLDSKRDGAGFSGGGFVGSSGAMASLQAGRIENTLRTEAAGDALLRMLGSSQEEMADSLLVGSERGDKVSVSSALKAGVDPNQVSGRNGFTPLHHACTRGHLEIALMLLKRGGASVSASTTDGLETPLHMAAYNGHLDICELLLKHGADPNANASDGESPLFFASRRSRSEVVALLLSTGADPNLLNRYGDRPVDDATDDDTIHQFLLHSTSVTSSSSSVASVVKEYASHMRASNLKRCLRFLRKAELARAGMVCVNWREASSDSRLWKPFGGLPKQLRHSSSSSSSLSSKTGTKKKKYHPRSKNPQNDVKTSN